MKKVLGVAPAVLVVSLLMAIGAFALGAYLGVGFAKGQETERNLNDAVLRTALNLEVMRAVSEGKSQEALGLIGSMNEVNLVYLMHYEKGEPKDEDFVRKKKVVLAKLASERANRPNRSIDSSDAERQEFERAVARYLERNR